MFLLMNIFFGNSGEGAAANDIRRESFAVCNTNGNDGLEWSEVEECEVKIKLVVIIL